MSEHEDLIARTEQLLRDDLMPLDRWCILSAQTMRKLADALAHAATRERDVIDLLFCAWKFDDKPHQLFSRLARMAKGHRDEAEIKRLMDEAYHNIHQWKNAATRERQAFDWAVAWQRDVWNRRNKGEFETTAEAFARYQQQARP